MKQYKPWLLPISWMILIFIGSSCQLEPGLSPFAYADKVVHFIEYGILGALLFFAFSKTTSIPNCYPLVLLCTLLSVIYGLSDEIHQLYVPTREFSFYDLLADMTGSLFFSYCSLIYRRYYPSGSKICKD